MFGNNYTLSSLEFLAVSLRKADDLAKDKGKVEGESEADRSSHKSFKERGPEQESHEEERRQETRLPDVERARFSGGFWTPGRQSGKSKENDRSKDKDVAETDTPKESAFDLGNDLSSSAKHHRVGYSDSPPVVPEVKQTIHRVAIPATPSKMPLPSRSELLLTTNTTSCSDQEVVHLGRARAKAFLDKVRSLQHSEWFQESNYFYEGLSLTIWRRRSEDEAEKQDEHIDAYYYRDAKISTPAVLPSDYGSTVGSTNGKKGARASLMGAFSSSSSSHHSETVSSGVTQTVTDKDITVSPSQVLVRSTVMLPCSAEELLHVLNAKDSASYNLLMRVLHGPRYIEGDLLEHRQVSLSKDGKGKRVYKGQTKRDESDVWSGYIERYEAAKSASSSSGSSSPSSPTGNSGRRTATPETAPVEISAFDSISTNYALLGMSHNPLQPSSSSSSTHHYSSLESSHRRFYLNAVEYTALISPLIQVSPAARGTSGTRSALSALASQSRTLPTSLWIPDRKYIDNPKSAFLLYAIKTLDSAGNVDIAAAADSKRSGSGARWSLRDSGMMIYESRDKKATRIDGYFFEDISARDTMRCLTRRGRGSETRFEKKVASIQFPFAYSSSSSPSSPPTTLPSYICIYYSRDIPERSIALALSMGNVMKAVEVFRIHRIINVNGNAWIPDESRHSCSNCLKKFNHLRRRHHCRGCGEVICRKCSMFKEAVISKNGLASMRICLVCNEKSTLLSAKLDLSHLTASSTGVVVNLSSLVPPPLLSSPPSASSTTQSTPIQGGSEQPVWPQRSHSVNSVSKIAAGYPLESLRAAAAAADGPGGGGTKGRAEISSNAPLRPQPLGHAKDKPTLSPIQKRREINVPTEQVRSDNNAEENVEEHETTEKAGSLKTKAADGVQTHPEMSPSHFYIPLSSDVGRTGLAPVPETISITTSIPPLVEESARTLTRANLQGLPSQSPIDAPILLSPLRTAGNAQDASSAKASSKVISDEEAYEAAFTAFAMREEKAKDRKHKPAESGEARQGRGQEQIDKAKERHYALAFQQAKDTSGSDDKSIFDLLCELASEALDCEYAAVHLWQEETLYLKQRSAITETLPARLSESSTASTATSASSSAAAGEERGSRKTRRTPRKDNENEGHMRRFSFSGRSKREREAKRQNGASRENHLLSKDVCEVARGDLMRLLKALRFPQPIIILDTAIDPRFKAVQGSLATRFFAGTPIYDSLGLCIGVVCVLDRQPRTRVADDHLRAMQTLANLAVISIEERAAVSVASSSASFMEDPQAGGSEVGGPYVAAHGAGTELFRESYRGAGKEHANTDSNNSPEHQCEDFRRGNEDILRSQHDTQRRPMPADKEAKIPYPEEVSPSEQAPHLFVESQEEVPPAHQWPQTRTGRVRPSTTTNASLTASAVLKARMGAGTARTRSRSSSRDELQRHAFADEVPTQCEPRRPPTRSQSPSVARHGDNQCSMGTPAYSSSPHQVPSRGRTHQRHGKGGHIRKSRAAPSPSSSTASSPSFSRQYASSPTPAKHPSTPSYASATERRQEVLSALLRKSYETQIQVRKTEVEMKMMANQQAHHSSPLQMGHVSTHNPMFEPLGPGHDLTGARESISMKYPPAFYMEDVSQEKDNVYGYSSLTSRPPGYDFPSNAQGKPRRKTFGL